MKLYRFSESKKYDSPYKELSDKNEFKLGSFEKFNPEKVTIIKNQGYINKNQNTDRDGSRIKHSSFWHKLNNTVNKINEFVVEDKDEYSLKKGHFKSLRKDSCDLHKNRIDKEIKKSKNRNARSFRRKPKIILPRVSRIFTRNKSVDNYSKRDKVSQFTHARNSSDLSTLKEVQLPRFRIKRPRKFLAEFTHIEPDFNLSSNRMLVPPPSIFRHLTTRKRNLERCLETPSDIYK
ncbi:unnamed protein product [Moneuplotes crassus]|uniref:Uncharacterized protein n=1 Tax=Euplotes crassus TaxID=5936 RepID=A0AAD2D2D6_EUPCR|nr:unnamed protein product [Moneuplotes crassus]